MRKYAGLLKYELKTLFKDSMTLFMLIYPLMMLFIMGFVLPEILDKTAPADANATTYTLLIGFVVVLSIGGFISGAMLGFSLLENKDENTLVNIAVSPITVTGYTNFKILYTYVIAIMGNFVMVGGLKIFATSKYQIQYMGQTINLLESLGWGHAWVFILTSSLIVPLFALVISSIAKNKIEGFAFMKSSGLIIMLPLLTLLNAFMDWKQYLLGVLPNFWTIKPLLNLVLSVDSTSNLPFFGYMIIGGVYALGLSLLAYRMFLKRANLK